VDLNAGCAGAQDLVKLRTRVEAVNIVEARAPPLGRFRLGRLSISHNQWLDLVDCVRFEECVGERGKNPQFDIVATPLTQRKKMIPAGVEPVGGPRTQGSGGGPTHL